MRYIIEKESIYFLYERNNWKFGCGMGPSETGSTQRKLIYAQSDYARENGEAIFFHLPKNNKNYTVVAFWKTNIKVET